MNNFTKFEKYAIINILSRIMKADGVIDPKEEDFMNHIYSSLAITISELENISSIDDIQANHIVLKMTDEKKAQVMTLFLGMAKADGFIHPKEIEIINQILQDL